MNNAKNLAVEAGWPGVDEPDRGAEIWRIYKMRRETDRVVRSGFGLCGCYPYRAPVCSGRSLNGGDSIGLSLGGDTAQGGFVGDGFVGSNSDGGGSHAESVSEHMLSSASLLYLLFAFYPSLFTANHQKPATKEKYDIAQLVAFRMTTLLLFHDAGEGLSMLGDRPDDGSQNQPEKDEVEFNYIANLTKNFPQESLHSPGIDLINDFWQFQHSYRNRAENSRQTLFYVEMAQLARLCDKVDAVLGAINYERLGHRGDLKYKNEYFGPITERDAKFIAMTEGDSSIAATWMAHVVSDYHDHFGFAQLLGVVRAAVVDVRGAWFPWWRSCCESLGLPPQE